MFCMWFCRELHCCIGFSDSVHHTAGVGTDIDRGNRDPTQGDAPGPVWMGWPKDSDADASDMGDLRPIVSLTGAPGRVIGALPLTFDLHEWCTVIKVLEHREDQPPPPAGVMVLAGAAASQTKRAQLEEDRPDYEGVPQRLESFSALGYCG